MRRLTPHATAVSGNTRGSKACARGAQGAAGVGRGKGVAADSGSSALPPLTRRFDCSANGRANDPCPSDQFRRPLPPGGGRPVEEITAFVRGSDGRVRAERARVPWVCEDRRRRSRRAGVRPLPYDPGVAWQQRVSVLNIQGLTSVLCIERWAGAEPALSLASFDVPYRGWSEVGRG